MGWLGRSSVLLLLCACGSDTFSTVSNTDAGGGDASADAGPVEVKRIFLTTRIFTPGSDIHGIVEADVACTKLAVAAKLPGVYLAWLSDAMTSPATRFFKSKGPYVLADGTTVVADSWTALTSADLKHPINQTEFGKVAPTPNNGSCPMVSSPMPWTGTNSDGTRAVSGNDCSGWSSSSGGEKGVAGASIASAAPDWSNDEKNCTPQCNNTNPLICVQQ